MEIPIPGKDGLYIETGPGSYKKLGVPEAGLLPCKHKYPAKTQHNKHVIITPKGRFDLIITCLLHCRFAGYLYRYDGMSIFFPRIPSTGAFMEAIYHIRQNSFFYQYFI